MSEASTLTQIPYTVRRSTRARRVRVNVHAHSGVEVVLPARAPERAAAAAVAELRPWIERRLGEAREVLAVVAARAGSVPYLGATLELVPQEGRARVHRSGERLLVPGGDPRPALERFFGEAFFFWPSKDERYAAWESLGGYPKSARTKFVETGLRSRDAKIREVCVRISGAA